MKEKDSEEDLSAPQHSPEESPRVHGADEDKRGPSCSEEKKSAGKKEADGLDKPSFRFEREGKLLKKREFDSVFKKGRRFRGGRIELIYLPNGLDGSRLGLVVPKKVGKAVVRNRIKRILREIFRLNRSRLSQNLDIVVRVFPSPAPFTFKAVEEEFIKFAQERGGSGKI